MQFADQKDGYYSVPDRRMDEQPEEMLTKFGLLRKKYLKENKGGVYSSLLLSNKLMGHLLEIQEQAENRMSILIEQLRLRGGLTEELKEENQILWIQKMNNIALSAEEIVLSEIIYS